MSRRIVVAVLCSSRYPGTIVVGALEIATACRNMPLKVSSGFHSPVERECLKLLIRQKLPVIVCPARSVIGPPPMRIPPEWRPAIADNRMFIRSAVDEGFELSYAHDRPPLQQRAPRRPTTALAEQRNRFVASISDAVFILHASHSGKLDRLATDLLATDKPIWTIDDPANASLISRGARSVRADTISQIWTP